MAWPNFLLIGASKSGTTSLHHYLGQHPEIFMSPVKEPSYFAFGEMDLSRYRCRIRERAREVLDRTEYQRLFAPGEHLPVRGESSALYLYVARAPRRIHADLSAARLLAVLRDPVERAYSHYLAMVRGGHERLSFEDALRAEDERVANDWDEVWHYRRMGLYDECLRRYLELFPREQLALLLFDDLSSDPLGVVQRVFRFLGVDAAFRPDVSSRHNVGGLPLSIPLYRYLAWHHPSKEPLKRLVPAPLRRRAAATARRWLLRPAPPLKAETAARLAREYRESILWVQDLLGRDLSHWLRY
jgi:hypothetical protein